MANILDVIMKTINDVQAKNAKSKTEETADPNVFDLIKDKINGLDKKIQNNRAAKGKKPVSILDLIKTQINSAQRANKKDPNVATAPKSVFDQLRKKLEDSPKRAASSGLRRIVQQYNLDVSRLDKNTLQQVQDQYNQELQALDQKYAQGMFDLIKRS